MNDNLIKLNCPITVLTGKQDKLVLGKHLKEWNKYSIKPNEHFAFDGGHFFIQHHKHHISKIITDAINKLK